MDSNILIILGMHRSGTSFLGQWLNKCGLNIGQNLMGAHETNKDGHFEDMDFLHFHEEILKRNDIPYGGLQKLKGLRGLELTQDEKDKMKELVLTKVQMSDSDWGWKDPRTCLFAEDYVTLFPKIKIIVILRDYKSIIHSLIKRKLRNRDIKYQKSIFHRFFYKGFYRRLLFEKYKIQYARITVLYYEKILSSIDKTNSIVVAFENISHAGNGIMERLKKWGFNLEMYPIDKIFKNDYVKSNINHIPTYSKLEYLQGRIKENGNFIE
ncbi:sulfotransferase [Saccharicrinis sp. FJH62]|uniref:sulfotransferase n=1 Tax=Saccharicrinis sp. FJH62 TaxID=3344657 RepID=UPI0035D45EA2